SPPSNVNSTRCRAPAKVMLAQLVSSWRRIVGCPAAKANSSSRSREQVSRRSRTGRMFSACMRSLLILVHEMFHSCFHTGARRPSAAQVEDEPWIACDSSSEFARRHVRPTEEHFDLAQQHGTSSRRE